MIPFDLTKRENMLLYFALKEKYGYSLGENRNTMIHTISCAFRPYVKKKSTIIIPESSSDFVLKVVQLLDRDIRIAKKNDIQYFKDLAPTLGLQKAELRSHLSRMEEMGSTFKINMLKATQRDKYIKHLFERTVVKQNSIIIDDSNFSGSTRDALIYCTKINSYVPIFSKE
jgi:hypothetical protein